MREWDRRDILRALAAGVIAGCSDPRSTVCIVGTSRSVPSYCLVESERLRVPGAANLISGQAQLLNVDDSTAVVVARDDNGFFAVSGICTHQCCLVALCNNSICSDLSTNPGDCKTTAIGNPSPNNAAFVCPCHGSSFRIDGTVMTGPARTPLPHYALQFEQLDAIVDTSQVVAADQRTPPPV